MFGRPHKIPSKLSGQCHPGVDAVQYVLHHAYHDLVGKGGDEGIVMDIESLVATGEYGEAFFRAVVLEAAMHKRRGQLGWGGKADAMEWTIGLVMSFAEAYGEKTRDYGPEPITSVPTKPPPKPIPPLPPPVINESMLKSLNDKYKESRQ